VPVIALLTIVPVLGGELIASPQDDFAAARDEITRRAQAFRADLEGEFRSRERDWLLRHKFSVDAFLTPILLVHELGDQRFPDFARLLSWSYGEALTAEPPAPDLREALQQELAGFQLGADERIACRIRSRHFQHVGPDVPVMISFIGVAGPAGGWFSGEWFEPCLATRDLDFPVHPEGFALEWSGERITQRDSRRGEVKYSENHGAEPPIFNNPSDLYALTDGLRLFPWLLRREPPAAPAHTRVAGAEAGTSSIVCRRADGGVIRTTDFRFDRSRLASVTIHQQPTKLRHEALGMFEMRREVGGREEGRERFRPAAEVEYLSGGRTVTIDFQPAGAGWPRGGVVPSALRIEHDGSILFEAEFLELRLISSATPDDDLFPPDPALAEAQARRIDDQTELYTLEELAAPSDPLVRRERIRHNVRAGTRAGDAGAVQAALEAYRESLRRDHVKEDMFFYSLEAWYADCYHRCRPVWPVSEVIDEIFAPSLDALVTGSLVRLLIRQLDQYRPPFALITAERLARRRLDPDLAAWLERIRPMVFGWATGIGATAPPLQLEFPYDERWRGIGMHLVTSTGDRFKPPDPIETEDDAGVLVEDPP
jgi:hypothetical protein